MLNWPINCSFAWWAWFFPRSGGLCQRELRFLAGLPTLNWPKGKYQTKCAPSFGWNVKLGAVLGTHHHSNKCVTIVVEGSLRFQPVTCGTTVESEEMIYCIFGVFECCPTRVSLNRLYNKYYDGCFDSCSALPI